MMPVITHLISKEVFLEDREGTDADVDCSYPHEETELEEVSVVSVSDTVVQPS